MALEKTKSAISKAATVAVTTMSTSCIWLAVAVFLLATQRMVIDLDGIDPELWSALADKSIALSMEGK